MPFNPDAYLAKKQPQESGGFDPDAYLAKAPSAPAEAPSRFSGVASGAGLASLLPGVSKAASAIDSVTGAPVRSAVSSLIENPKDLMGAARAYGNQFAKDPKLAPTGKDQMKRLGLSDQSTGRFPSPAATFGFLAELVEDPGTLIAAGTKAIPFGGRMLSKGAELFPKAVAGVSKAFTGLADTAALKHLRPTAQANRIIGKPALKRAAREALDSGAIQFGRTAEKTASNLDDLILETGRVKGDIVEAATGTVDPAKVAKKFEDDVIAKLRGTTENKPLVRKLEEKKAEFLKDYAGDGTNPKMTPQQLEAEKMAVSDNINWLTDPKPAAEANQGWAGVLRESAEDVITDPNFKRAKKAYGNLETARNMADRTASLQDGGLYSKMTDVGLGTQILDAARSGEPVTAAGLAAGRGLIKGRAASSVAVGSDKTAKALDALAKSLGWTTKEVEALLQSPGFERSLRLLYGPGVHGTKTESLKRVAENEDSELAAMKRRQKGTK